MADIADGTSYTAAFSEHIRGDSDNTVINDRMDTFGPKTHPQTLDAAVADCENLNWRDPQYQNVSDVGVPWPAGFQPSLGCQNFRSATTAVREKMAAPISTSHGP